VVWGKYSRRVLTYSHRVSRQLRSSCFEVIILIVFRDNYSRRVLRSLLSSCFEIIALVVFWGNCSHRVLRSLLSSCFEVITLVVFRDRYSRRVSRSLLSSWCEVITLVVLRGNYSHRVLRQLLSSWFDVITLIVFWDHYSRRVLHVSPRVLISYSRVLRVLFSRFESLVWDFLFVRHVKYCLPTLLTFELQRPWLYLMDETEAASVGFNSWDPWARYLLILTPRMEWMRTVNWHNQIHHPNKYPDSTMLLYFSGEKLC